MSTNPRKQASSRSPIYEQGLLVEVPISVASMSKVDKELSSAVASERNASATRIKTSKVLVESPNHKAMKKIMGQVRNNLLKELTIPWDEKGKKYLPIGLKAKFDDQLKVYMDAFEKAKRAFIAEYDDLIEEAKRNSVGLGEAFNAADYPSKAELEDKFTMSVAFDTLNDPNDARVKLSEAMRNRIIKDAEDVIIKRTEDAHRVVIERVVDVLTHLAEKLEEREVDENGKVVSTFRDNTLEKAQRLAEALPSLNLTGDPALTKAANEMLGTLTSLKAKDLRADPAKGKDVAKKVSEIADKLRGAVS